MKLEAIFEHVGMDRVQIVAAVAKASRPWEPTAVVKKTDQRPNCPICGKRINATNCVPISPSRRLPYPR